MEKLPEDFKKKWLEALRSGEYKQGKKHLVIANNNNKNKYYCCLGVAGKICGLGDEHMKNFDFLTENFANCGIPEILIGEFGEAAELAEMNDNGNTFEEIADYIEKEL